MQRLLRRMSLLLAHDVAWPLSALEGVFALVLNAR